MGQLIFEIVRNGISTKNSVEILDTDLDRIAYTYKNLYFPAEGIYSPEVEATDDGMGNTTPYIPATYRQPTTQEVIIKISEVLMNLMKDTTKEFEKNLAIKQAKESVTEIVTSDVQQEIIV